MMQIDPRKPMLLAAHAGCCLRTARDYLMGRDPKGTVLRVRLEEARAQLGLERQSPVDLNPPRSAA